MLTASCALAGGASKVLISDVSAIKLAIAAQIPGIIPVDLTKEDLVERVREETGAGVLMWLSSARARRSHTRHSGS